MTNNTNLRLLECEPIDSRTIKATFTETLNNTINIDNVTITALSNNIPNATAIKTSIKDNTLYIKTSPLTPSAMYKVLFQSTISRPFVSVIGSLLYEDGTTNAPLIQGPHDPTNFFYDRIVSSLKDGPYDTENPGIIRSYIESSSSQLLKAYNDIRQSKTDNYLSITVKDEIHKRGKGPYDRLNNEGAYEIIRVGLFPEGATNSNTINLSSFPNRPISLQQEIETDEVLFFGSKGSLSTFNQTTCTLKNNNVIKVTKITVKYANGTTKIYDINAYGYQLQSSRYDSKASTYTLLNNNQFKFSEKAILDGFKTPVAGDNITVSYIYKCLGRTIDKSTINIYTTTKTVRQVACPLMNVFSLGYKNICNQYGTLCTENGISFLDPLASPPYSQRHPAFQKELAYNERQLPAHVGEFSIDYTNGKVYVYGQDDLNLGTGAFPPVMTYYYRNTYVNELDYNYDSTLSEIAANKLRELIGKPVVISYEYSEDLIPGVDYKAQVHKEELTERAQNRVIGSGAVQTLYTPITNAFRVYNETTGEVYGINRFTDNTIYFSYQNPPLFVNATNERVRFEQISGETLVKSDEFTNSNNKRIFVFSLGTSIVGATDDCLGSCINTSLLFTNKTIFTSEQYYDSTKTNTQNINKLTTTGQYTVNYTTGNIYVAVDSLQIDDVGGVSYKSKNIITSNQHITAINQIYSLIDSNSKTLYEVNTFDNTSLSLLSYPKSDNTTNIVSNNLLELNEDVLSVRHIYDQNAVLNNGKLYNFALNATISANTITINPINIVFDGVIASGNTIVINDIGYVDSNITIDSVVYIQNTSFVELYNTTLHNGSITGNTITLPVDTTGQIGDVVRVSLNIKLKNNSNVFVDYNRGNLYVDYIYCNDEIIVSYEHGDNCLDFRESSTVDENQIYYVSYKYGALRDALFANFGTLIDIDILHNFNVELDRERYRDALMACLQTFPKGSTVESIKNIAKIISHVEPNIWESFNDEWVIGTSSLYNNPIIANGPLEIVPGKFNYALNVKDSSDCIMLPFSSHFKLERGTLEMFAVPNWNGIDNDATITYTILRDGLPLTSDHIWIGSNNTHPTLNDDKTFSVSKTPLAFGIPSDISNSDSNSWGAYIYFDVDSNNWKFFVKDTPGNMLVTHTYKATLQTNGEFHNVKSVLQTVNNEDGVTSSSKKLTLNMTISDSELDGYALNMEVFGYSFDGIQFTSDCKHYFFDYVADLDKPNENRISILKDGNGYLSFIVKSARNKYNKSYTYQVSKDISSWVNGDVHFIAASWNIASINKRDEIHLFVDGQEVYNVLRYGGKPDITINNKFRTVSPEIISNAITANTLTNTDLVIRNNSDIVISANSDFGLAHINVGDKLYIDNPVINGPNTYFTILEIVDAHSVKLDHTFTYSMTDVEFTVNPVLIPISTNIMYESNIAVSIIRGGTETELPGLRATVPMYHINVNEFGQPILMVRGGAMIGDQIAIRTLGLSYKRVRERIYNWGTTSNQINTQLPAPINLDNVKIIPVLLPRTNVIMTTPTTYVQMQPHSQGRTLELSITNTSNCDFASQDLIITITGTTVSGNTSEVLNITKSGLYKTTELFKTVTSIVSSAVVFQSNRAAYTLEVKEAYSITVQENNNNFAIIRYSYKESKLTGLTGSGSTITSLLPVFDKSHIGYVLSVSNMYCTITEVIDANTITVNQTVSFSNVAGDLYNVSIARSGFANGQFTFEQGGSAGQPYYLQQGYYDLDYATYLEIPFEIKALNCSIGSDCYGNNQADSIIEEVRSLDITSTDTRIGETYTDRTITSDCNTATPYLEDYNTLMLLHLDDKPIADSSIIYESYSQNYLQTDQGVNDNFGKALYVDSTPFVIDNTNILFNNEGTIEFWVSPKFDTANDPKYRMYFDVAASYIESVNSLTKRDVVLNRAAKYIVSITVEGFPNINYADGCVLSANGKSIQLGKELPNNVMKLNVVYIPYRSNGDRISIYKSPINSICFDMVANGKLYSLSCPAYWPKDTWHKITATWKCNSKNKQDEMHLFVDGIEKNKVSFGTGITFGSTYTFSQLVNPSNPTSIRTNISLKETFNKMYVGGNSFGGAIGHCRISNLKVSRKVKQLIAIGNKLIDNDYQLPQFALPVVEDLYTTYLMNFDTTVNKVEDFSILRNATTGIFDFELDVIDSFGIIENSLKSKEILNTLVKKLKPAISKAFINYIS